MAIQTIDLTVDGYNVKITQFAAVRGFKLKTRLFKLILPVLGGLLGQAEGGKAPKHIGELMTAEVNLEAALTALAERLDEVSFFNLLLDLLSSTAVNDKVIDQKYFDELFIANYGLAYRLVVEVVKANGFFDLGGIGNLLSESPISTPKK